MKAALLGLLERLPGGDPLADEDEEDATSRDEVREMDYAGLGPGAEHPAEALGEDEAKADRED